MLTIRLARGGAKKRPFYHIVAADSRRARDGRYVERLGYFNPIAAGGEARLLMTMDRVDHWLSKGAQPSDRVAKLIKDFAKLAKTEAAAETSKSAKPAKAKSKATKAKDKAE